MQNTSGSCCVLSSLISTSKDIINISFMPAILLVFSYSDFSHGLSCGSWLSLNQILLPNRFSVRLQYLFGFLKPVLDYPWKSALYWNSASKNLDYRWISLYPLVRDATLWCMKQKMNLKVSWSSNRYEMKMWKTREASIIQVLRR